MAMTPSHPRVVMVVRLFHPWVGGTERQAQTLARRLADRGVDVRIVTGRWFRGTERRQTLDGIPVFRNHTLWEGFGVRGLRTASGYLYMGTLAWHLWRTRGTYDVIHVHGMNYHSAVAVRMGRLSRRPTITKVANSGAASDVDKMRLGRQLRGARFLLGEAARSDRFVALNPAVVEELCAIGVPPGRIVSLPNGVSLEGIVPRPDHAGTRVATVVYVGRLHPQKGLDTLVDAVALVHRRSPGSLRAVLIGEGPHRAELETQIRRLGLAEWVTLAGERADVSESLRSADAFVLPSHAEGLSNALLEAMAHGLPVVVSNVPGNVDVIDHDVNGLIFPVGDADSLADRLGRLAADDALRDRLGRAARATVEAEYDLDLVVDSYVALYQELASTKIARG
jgi:glycosyltransferase involved in cell wall biosynthesis